MHKIEPAPAPLKGGAAYGIGPSRAPADAPSWWLALESPALDDLIRRALADNFDVRASRERINQALASYRRGGAALLPQLSLEGHVDDEVWARGRDKLRTRNEGNVVVDWEADVFGRLGNIRKTRAAEAWARVHEAEDFRLRLSADVAETYVGVLEQRELLALLDRQVGTANELLRIIDQRYREGLISNLDVLQQQSQVAELESQIPAARSTLQDLESQLGALLGTVPGDAAPAVVATDAPWPRVRDLARLDRADELLWRRPDLRATRALLVAADADTGRALAERLPRFTLSAEAFRIEGRGTSVSAITLGADVVQPLLDWGLRRQEWVRSKAVYRERLNAFSQTYLRAVWQVEALVQNEARQRELLAALSRRRGILDATIRQARSRYDAGLTDYLPVLSATQQLYAVEQRLVREERRLVSLRVALHRALGGPVGADVVAPDQKLPPKK